MYCLVLKGPSAAGKSTITKHLAWRLREREKLAIIPGDYLSHFIYHCHFTNGQLELKYQNICSLIENFLGRGYDLLLQDLFRRQQDLDRVISCLGQYTDSIHLVHLTAPPEVLKDRRPMRPPPDAPPRQTIVQKYELAEGVRAEGEMCIDTSRHTIQETVNLILQGYAL